MLWLRSRSISVSEVINSRDKEYEFKGAFLIVFIVALFPLPVQAKYGGGSGSADDPYLIYTAEQMNAIGAEPNDWRWDKHFKLMADIDLGDYTGTQFNIIGTDGDPFSGTFDGSSHKIFNFTYSSTGKNCVALFGCLSGVIKDFVLLDPNICADTGSYIGSLVGKFREGAINGCCAQGGSVSGYEYVGQLIGGTIPTSILSYFPRLELRNCYARANVSGTRNVGGLIGFYEGHLHPAAQGRYKMSNCYATGNVSGTERVGGLAGRVNYATISNCYSSARVEGNAAFGGLIGTNSEGTITDSFWDIETSGLTTSAGGTGKTTAEMKQKATFTNWDFVNVWDIAENQTYPFLRRCPTGDLNGDCKVDLRDFVILATHWLEDNTP